MVCLSVDPLVCMGVHHTYVEKFGNASLTRCMCVHVWVCACLYITVERDVRSFLPPPHLRRYGNPGLLLSRGHVTLQLAVGPSVGPSWTLLIPSGFRPTAVYPGLFNVYVAGWHLHLSEAHWLCPDMRSIEHKFNATTEDLSLDSILVMIGV